MEKQKIINIKSVGYWLAFGGVELKDIEYGINDYCICVSGAWSKDKKVHRLLIRSSSKGQYINLNGTRLYFSDCIRM